MASLSKKGLLDFTRTFALEFARIALIAGTQLPLI